MKRFFLLFAAIFVVISAMCTSALAAESGGYIPWFYNFPNDVGDGDLAIKSDGTLWVGDNTEGTMEFFDENVLKAYCIKDPLDSVDYIYVIKRDNTLWVINDYYGSRRTDTKTKLMGNVQDFVYEKGVGGSSNFGYYVLKTDGTVLCWGAGGTGIPGARNALEEGGPISIPMSKAVTLATNVRMLNIGYLVKNDDTLWTWGVGRRPFSDESVNHEYPVKIMDDVKSISGNYIIKTDNSLWAWGYVRFPGNGTDNHNGFLAQPVKILDNVKKVTEKGAALKYDGTVYVWGWINNRIFPECPEKSDTPVKVAENIRDISGGPQGMLMLKYNGELWSHDRHNIKGIDRYEPYKFMTLCAFNIEGNAKIAVNQETVLSATYWDENGNLIEPHNVTWSVAEGDAEIIPNGNNATITPKKGGVVKIKAVYNPTGEVAEFDIFVEDYSIKVEGRKPVKINEEIELEALLYSGEERSYDAADYEWEIVEKEFAEITQYSGAGNSCVKIKGKKSGIATVKVTEKYNGIKEEFKLLVDLPPNIVINATSKKAEYGITQGDFTVVNQKYPELDYDKLTEEEYKSLTLVNPKIDLNLSQCLYAASGHRVSADYTHTPSVFVYDDMTPGYKTEFTFNFAYGNEALTTDDAFVTVAVYGEGYVPLCQHFDLDVDLPVKVYVNGEKVEFDTMPVISGGRTLVPIRKIFNALGAKDEDIIWDNEERKATATVNGKKIVLVADSATAYVDGVEKTLDEPARILSGGRTYVPVRFIAEAFGANVHWENDCYTVCIGSGKKIKAENNKISNIKPDKKGEDAGFTTEEKEKWFSFGETYNVYNGGEVAKGTYQVENLVIKEPLVLPAGTKILVKGYLNIENKVSFEYGSEINVVGGDVTVKKNGILDMAKGGTLVCDENFIFNSGTNHKPYLGKGIIEVGGNVTLKKNFHASGENEFHIKNKKDLHTIDVAKNQQFNILKVEERGFEVLDIKKEFTCAKSFQVDNWDVLSDYSFDNNFELTSADCSDPEIKARVETGLTRALISESLGTEFDLGQLGELTNNMTFKAVNDTKTYEYYDAASKSIKKYTLVINYNDYELPEINTGFGSVRYISGTQNYFFVIYAPPEKAEEILTSFKATVTANMASSVVGAYKSNYVTPLANNAKNTIKALILKELPADLKMLVNDAEEVKKYIDTFKKINDMLNKLK